MSLALISLASRRSIFSLEKFDMSTALQKLLRENSERGKGQENRLRSSFEMWSKKWCLDDGCSPQVLPNQAHCYIYLCILVRANSKMYDCVRRGRSSLNFSLNGVSKELFSRVCQKKNKTHCFLLRALVWGYLVFRKVSTMTEREFMENPCFKGII